MQRGCVAVYGLRFRGFKVQGLGFLGLRVENWVFEAWEFKD